MKSKMLKMISAFIVLVVLIGVYFGMKSYVSKKETEDSVQEDEAASIFTADAEKVRSIEFLIDKQEVVFKKENDTWVKQDEEEFPVAQDVLTNAVGVFADFTSDRVLEDVEDLSEYGLDTPQNTITVTMDDNSTMVIRVGMENEISSQYYVSKDDDRHTVYVVPDVNINYFMNPLYDYAEKEGFPDVDASAITQVSVKKGDSSYELIKGDGGLWDISDDRDESEQADTAAISNLTSSIANLEFDEFVDYQAEDLSKYGLEEPYAVVTVSYTEEVEETDKDTDSEVDAEDENDEDSNNEENIVTVEKELVLFVGDETEAENRYVRVNDSKQIYTIPKENLDTVIGKNASDFWNMTVNYLSLNNLDSLAIDKGNEEHTIIVSRETSSEDQEETVTYQLDGKQIENEILFTTFYNKLINMAAQQRLTEKLASTESPEMSVVFTDMDGSKTTVYYYEYDTNFYAAVVDSKVFLINKMTVREMMDAYEEMIGDSAETDSDE